MNKHKLFDRLTAAIASRALGKNRFFSQSIESPGYKAFLEEITLSVSSLEEGIHEAEAKTSNETLNPAYYVAQWKGTVYPTIIYHHGNNERPFDLSRYAKNSFRTIFMDQKDPIDANLIAIRAPFHHSTLKAYQKKITHLSNFVAMLAASTKLIDALVDELRKKTDSRILVSGISLGGWVTNLHRSFCNTADVYVPMLAGAALDHLFTDSPYRKMGGKLARNNPQQIKNTLNFEEAFKKVKDDNVFPLLGRYDQYIQYHRQKEAYRQERIKILNTGHVTSFLAGKELKNHILSAIREKS
jgi:predicted esterase YcpF (UPF0227 family)